MLELRAALDASHEPVARLSALWPDFSVRETWEGRLGADGTPAKGAILLGGTAPCDRTKEVRRSASLELSDATGSLSPRVLGDLFHPDSLIRVERGVRIAGQVVYVTLFTGPVTVAVSDMDGKLSVSADDVLSRAQQQLGEVVVLDAEMPGEAAIERLLRSRLGYAGPAWSLDAGGRSIGTVRSFGEDDDALASAMAIARDLACELLAYRNGEVILRPVEDPTARPADRSHVIAPGVADMLSLERTISATPHNRAVVIAERTDGPVLRGVAEVTDPAHPLHPYNLGRIRQAPIRRTSQITRQDVANAAARVDLYALALRQLGVGSVTLPDPTVDEGHVHEFTEERTGTTGRWLLDTVTQPVLMGSTGLSARRAESLFA